VPPWGAAEDACRHVSTISLEFLFALLALCLVLSAFFSGTETALMSVNRYRLRTLANSGHRGAILAEELLVRPDKLIGLILLGNNLVNNLAATLVAVIVLRVLDDEWLALGAAVLTLFMLIFCEVGPKTYGALHAGPVSTASAYVYKGLQWSLYPAVWVINRITNGVLRLVGVKVDKQAQQNALTREELRTVVAEAGAMIPRRHQQMLMSILDLERVTVDDIMIPRSEVMGIDLNDDWDRILERIEQTLHTRLPVYEGELENLIGVLHMKRVANALAQGRLTHELIREMAAQREAHFVPEGTPLNTQLLNFQKSRRRFGFVVDEYGDVQGLITLEDLLEEIVGEFSDAPGAARHRSVRQDSDGSFLVSASASVRALNRSMHWTLPTNGPKTLSGLIIEQLEAIPPPGTRLQVDGYTIEVMQIADNTVRTARIRVPGQTSSD
jgi:Mg2+/Co2+ transporter CorB